MIIAAASSGAAVGSISGVVFSFFIFFIMPGVLLISLWKSKNERCYSPGTCQHTCGSKSVFIDLDLCQLILVHPIDIHPQHIVYFTRNKCYVNHIM